MSRALVAVIIVGVLVVGIVAGVLIGGGGDDDTTTTDDEEASSTGEQTTTTATTTTTTTLPGVEDGTHLVPDDIAPGRWMATGSDDCFYARLSGLGGTPEQQIAGSSPTVDRASSTSLPPTPPSRASTAGAGPPT